MLKHFLLASLSLLVVTLVHAQDVPTDEEVFAKVAADRVQRELPDYRIAPTSRLTLEGKRADGESTGQLSLDRIYAFCSRNSRNCSAALDQYAKGIGEIVKERDRPIEKSMVRIAIRPAEYVERIKKQMVTGPIAMYSKPIGGGLAVVPVLDYSRSVRFVGEKDLLKLGVSEEEIFNLGEENLRSSVKPLAQVAPVPSANAFGTITGEDYASSRVVFHGEWKSLAEKLNGNLVVMLPASDVLLYGDGSTAVGIEALRTYGSEMAKKSTRPLSPVVLRWLPTGWEEVK